MRMAIEHEALYAAEYPFVDYGCDLYVMAEMEKGVRIEKFHEREADVKAEPLKKKDVEQYLSKMRPVAWHKVPETFVGKGPNGYMLYDWIWHRKRGAPATSKAFQDVVRR